MKLFELFGKRKKDVPPQKESMAGGEESLDMYSGMRVEVTTFDGRLLFVAKLIGLRGSSAELHQYSEASLPQDAEPVRVRIRGYNDHERKAVYMEGTIAPDVKHIWKVEELTVARIGNDRAFFRLDTDIDSTITTFGGFGAGEQPCKLLNISVGGACISSAFQFHEDDKFLLKVKLLEDRDISVMYCQVLRIIDKGDSGYKYGCRVLELNENDQAKITQNIFAAQRKKRGAG